MDDADKELGKKPRRTGSYVSEQIALLISPYIIEDLIYRLFFTDSLQTPFGLVSAFLYGFDDFCCIVASPSCGCLFTNVPEVPVGEPHLAKV